MIYNVGIYLRLSKDNGEKTESDSITNQRNIIKDFCLKYKNFNVCKEYIDDGYTGTNFNRPSFKDLIRDIENKEINCVITKDLSRLGRNYILSSYYIFNYFPSKGVRFISINDNYDSNDPEFNLIIPIKTIFNEQYSRDISKKVQSTILSKAREGLFIGSHACYGYKKSENNKNKLIIDEYAANIVKRIFNLFIQGKNKLAIAKILNEEKILCPTDYKIANGSKYENPRKLNSTCYWTANTISAILKQEIYTGTLVQGKRNASKFFYGTKRIKPETDWIKVENTHKAIIDKETFDKVQNLLSLNTRQNTFKENIGIFAGLIKCGDCGHSLIKSKECTKYKGNKYFYLSYRCRTYKYYGKSYCTSHRITHNVLVKAILNDLNLFIDKLNNIDKIIEKASEDKNKELENKTRIENIKKELRKLQKKKKRAYSDYNDDLLSKNEYLEFKNEIENKEIDLKNILEVLNIKPENKIHTLLENPIIKKLYNREKLTENELTRELIIEFVKSIIVYEDKETKEKNIEITYTFSNEIELLG